MLLLAEKNNVHAYSEDMSWPQKYLYLNVKEWRASLVAQMVQNLPTMWDTKVWCLSREDPLEEGMATHSGILAWRIPWTEEPGRLQSTGSQRVRHDRATDTFCFFPQRNKNQLLVQCREPLWEVPPVTRKWRKYQAGKAVRDPIHDEVTRKKRDRQGRLG